MGGRAPGAPPLDPPMSQHNDCRLDLFKYEWNVAVLMSSLLTLQILYLEIFCQVKIF